MQLTITECGRLTLGASDWEYVVPYQGDLAAALVGLRRRVFEDGDYIGPAEFGLPAPASVDDLANEVYWEFMGAHGTHSILDILDVTSPDNISQEYATIRPLTEDEYIALFGSSTPGHDAFMALSNSDRLHDYVDAGRGTGRVAILWEDGQPSELAFWGYSGD